VDTKIKCVLLNVTAVPYQFVDAKSNDTKKGITYKALIYANQKVTECKTTEAVYAQIKGDELLQGTAEIEIKQTNFGGKDKVEFWLNKFV